jgi:hypothetical protein
MIWNGERACTVRQCLAAGQGQGCTRCLSCGPLLDLAHPDGYASTALVRLHRPRRHALAQHHASLGCQLLKLPSTALPLRCPFPSALALALDRESLSRRVCEFDAACLFIPFVTANRFSTVP